MGEKLQLISWISSKCLEDRRRKAEGETEQTIIINDLPRPEDFRLTPEEYKRLYEERLKNGGEMPATPEEYTAAFAENTESSLFSISWLSGSIDTHSESEDSQPVVIKERPVATLEQDPEEYKLIKEELEKERESMSGYYNDPKHFYSISQTYLQAPQTLENVLLSHNYY